METQMIAVSTTRLLPYPLLTPLEVAYVPFAGAEQAKQKGHSALVRPGSSGLDKRRRLGYRTKSRRSLAAAARRVSQTVDHRDGLPFLFALKPCYMIRLSFSFCLLSLEATRGKNVLLGIVIIVSADFCVVVYAQDYFFE